MTEPVDAAGAVADAHRREWAVVLAATMRTARDLDLAEECVQEAYTAALTSWPRNGVPDSPAAWLTTAARRRAVDAVRRSARLRPKLPLLVVDDVGHNDDDDNDNDNGDNGGEGLVVEDAATVVRDERLRLIFMCCHPALAPEAQLALTLRLVCGMPTAEVARALFVTEPTMHARLTRAKRKIAGAGIPLRVPPPAELPDRLATVLGVVYLLFTIGHAAPSGATVLRPEALDESLRVARVLRELMPDEREVAGLLAMLLVIDARRPARQGADGRPVSLEDQDRDAYDRDAIAEADALLVAAMRAGSPGRYVLQGAIAALHAKAPTYEATDWHQILALYARLLEVWPSPAAALSRAVALSMVEGPAAALDAVEVLEQDHRLDGYHYLPAVKAHLLEQLGRTDEAAVATLRALELVENDAERALLQERLGRLWATPSEMVPSST